MCACPETAGKIRFLLEALIVQALDVLAAIDKKEGFREAPANGKTVFTTANNVSDNKELVDTGILNGRTNLLER